MEEFFDLSNGSNRVYGCLNFRIGGIFGQCPNGIYACVHCVSAVPRQRVHRCLDPIIVACTRIQKFPAVIVLEFVDGHQSVVQLCLKSAVCFWVKK